MRAALKFAYDGRKYHGYARQPQLDTVEGALIDCLKSKGYIKDPKSSLFRSASRTDKGVSALGNVIAFNTDHLERLLENCNSELDNILCYGIKDVDADFYPRHARQRVYRYYLKNNNYDSDIIKSTVLLFEGTQDFSNFARIEPHRNPVRTIEKIVVNESDNYFIIDFYAQTYLWNQIRRIISAIEKLANEKITSDQIMEGFSNPNKSVDFGVARSEPLILMDITYDFSFKIDKYWKKKKNEIEQKLIDEIKCLF